MSATITAIMFFLMLSAAPAQSLDFDINRALIKTVINSPDGDVGSFTITNSNEQIREFILSSSSPKLSLSETRFTLQAGQTRTIDISIQNAERVNTFEIYVRTSSSEATIPVVVEYEDIDYIFNALVKINQTTKRVEAGDKIVSAIDIFDLEDIGTQRVDVDYIILDQKTEVVLSETEEVLVSNRNIAEKNFTLPSYLDEGDYVLATVLTFNSRISTATDTFIIENGGPSILSIASTAIIVLIILAMILLYLMVHTHLHVRGIFKAHREQIFRFRQRHLHAKRDKYRRKLAALTEAHKQGFLSKDRHREAKKHFKEKIRDIEWFMEKD